MKKIILLTAFVFIFFAVGAFGQQSKDEKAIRASFANHRRRLEQRRSESISVGLYKGRDRDAFDRTGGRCRGNRKNDEGRFLENRQADSGFAL